MHPMLNIAVKAARRAGNIIQRASRDLDLVKVQQKQQNDFVTEVDKAAEQAIIDVLHEAYPDHAILAEESGHAEGKGQGKEYVWIIDPLDGTTNFIHGLPQYAVSIALEHRGQVTQAVVYDPSKNELFTATRGAGAYLNDRRMRVSRRLRMNEALIGTGFPFREEQGFDEYMKAFAAITRTTAGVRRPGAAALDLAYVACGRFDGFWERGIHAWDIAAGGLLVTESGGLITNFRGESAYVHSGEVVCATPKLFPALLSTVQAAYGVSDAAKSSKTTPSAKANETLSVVAAPAPVEEGNASETPMERESSGGDASLEGKRPAFGKPAGVRRSVSGGGARGTQLNRAGDDRRNDRRTGTGADSRTGSRTGAGFGARTGTGTGAGTGDARRGAGRSATSRTGTPTVKYTGRPSPRPFAKKP
jgi:myo-inositol-1(or 4)-monophosphatase